MAEHVIAAYQVSQLKAGKEFSYAALRYFNVIGADKEARVGPLPKKQLKAFSRVVDACFDAVTSGEPMKVYGTDYKTPDGTAIRDYIHVWDLVRAHLAVIAAVHSNSAIPYNVGIGHGFSNKQLVEACGKAVGRQVDIVYKERRRGRPGPGAGRRHQDTARAGLEGGVRGLGGGNCDGVAVASAVRQDGRGQVNG